MKGSFNWGCKENEGEMAESVLRGIDLEFKKNETVLVTGPVGSGKSSMISALLGNLQYEDGSEVQAEKSISYCSQVPWLINATVRENIVMDLPFNESRYKETVELCQLSADLAILPAGDQTELGQRGINLSGGQKARVNLARAIYKDSSAYLLDDPISALDAHVAQNIMEKLIFGFLSDKTVILVSHAVQYASKADRVLCLNKGETSYFGLSSGFDISSVTVESKQEEEEIELPKQKSKLVKEEVKKVGAIPLSTYLKFVEYFKGWKTILTAFSRAFLTSDAACSYF